MPNVTDAPHSCGANARPVPARADAARRHCAPSPCACGPCARSRRALADALVRDGARALPPSLDAVVVAHAKSVALIRDGRESA